MAYNRRNKLLMMQRVIDVYLEHKKPGVSTAYVWREHIYPVYRISITTLYNYLNTPVGRELKRLNKERNE
jgi:hypothetical protein